MTPMIAPSILAADFVNLARDIELIERAGAEIIHVDIMDGHFVPNLTIGLPVLEAVRRVTQLTLDVHLMIANPDQMAEKYVEKGADWVTVHYEATSNLDQLLRHLKSRGARAGVVLNPHSPVCLLDEILPVCDHVLLMSVNPGFGGQEFISTSFEKVRKLRDQITARDLDIKIEIDGGIGLDNVADAIRAGVDVIVAGSAIFQSPDPAATYREMERLAKAAMAGR